MIRKETKPILIVTLNNQIGLKRLDEVRQSFGREFDDYHVLVITGNVNDPVFQALYPSDFPIRSIDEIIVKVREAVGQ